MKTSATQFEMLVNFMEEHGDINKPSRMARGRIQAMNLWETLTNLLNTDPTGPNRSTDKWKKVWSDFKNNTKKKASKINKSIRGTGGGPAYRANLTEHEQRVLNIIGSEAATGLRAVAEAGISQSQVVINETPANDSNRTQTLPSTPNQDSPTILTLNIADNAFVADVWPYPAGTSHSPRPQAWSPVIRIASPAQVDARMSPVDLLNTNQDSPTRRRRVAPVRRRRVLNGSPNRRIRTPTRITTPRRRGLRPLSHIDSAAQHFLNSDEEWRAFLRKKHADDMEIEKEKMRIRDKELEVIEKWQDIANRAIDAINQFVETKL